MFSSDSPWAVMRGKGTRRKGTGRDSEERKETVVLVKGEEVGIGMGTWTVGLLIEEGTEAETVTGIGEERSHVDGHGIMGIVRNSAMRAMEVGMEDEMGIGRGTGIVGEIEIQTGAEKGVIGTVIIKIVTTGTGDGTDGKIEMAIGEGTIETRETDGITM